MARAFGALNSEIFWILVVTLAVTPSARSQSNDTVVLPAIISVWKLPGDAQHPETTLEEIGHCMGSSMDAKDAYRSVQQDQPGFSKEASEVASQSSELNGQRDQLQKLNQELADQAKLLQAKNEALERRRAEIDKRRGQPFSNDQAKVFQAQIASFNQDIAALKAQYNALQSEIVANQKSVDAFNVLLATSNQRSSAFNLRVADYNARVSQLNQMSAEYMAHCAGERTIAK